MNDILTNWMLGIAIIGVIIIIIGFITGRNLPEIEKKIYIRKFAAVALALIFFGFSLFAPSVASYSNAGFITNTRHLDELKAGKLNSLEDIADFNKKQSYIISDLTEDIKDLRADLYSANNFYETTTRVLLFTVAILVVNFAFTKKEEEK